MSTSQDTNPAELGKAMLEEPKFWVCYRLCPVNDVKVFAVLSRDDEARAAIESVPKPWVAWREFIPMSVLIDVLVKDRIASVMDLQKILFSDVGRKR